MIFIGICHNKIIKINISYLVLVVGQYLNGVVLNLKKKLSNRNAIHEMHIRGTSNRNIDIIYKQNSLSFKLTIFTILSIF